MSEFDIKEPDLGHPDAAIQLASAVHRFKVPLMTRKVCFVDSFRTTGSHAKTKAVMKKADEARKKLEDAVSAGTVSGERVFVEATRYLPLIHQILLTCKVQPEMARLDERLMFEWKSGVEKDPSDFTSEALMYDMVMCIACQALAKSAAATEASLAGEFATASREFAAGAGIFKFLAEDQLPKWVAKGSNVNVSELPSEATVGPCTAFVDLLLANAQQMAVATVLIKKGVPNYGLLAKLCYGIYERLTSFMNAIRKSFQNMERMDKDFFTVITFQTQLQWSLCGYFHARATWDKQEYGLAIAMLSEASIGLNTRAHAAKTGMPEIGKGSPLIALQKHLKDLKAHYGLLLKTWEDDNSSVYFERVPQKVPEESKLSQPLYLSKPTPYKVDEVEPLPLSLPEHELQRTDSDLARRLQAQLDAGEDI